MSDTETNEPDEYYERENEKISITRADARKFDNAYEVAFTTRGELYETTAHVGKLHKRIEELEANATSLKGRVSALFLGLIVLALFQAGYLGP
jgi:hypothetical protein